MTDLKPVSNAPMSSAPMKYRSDGLVDWGDMWDTFCALALDGGPSHLGDMLPAPNAPDSTDPNYRFALDEIIRGIRETSGLQAEPAEPGWVAVQCASSRQAQWFCEAILQENVQARWQDALFFVPVGDSFTVTGEIKNVVTAVAKTAHYQQEHLPNEVSGVNLNQAILLLDHGSRDPRAKPEFDAIARTLQARCDLPVYPAYLELAEPTVLDQLETLAKAGVRKVWALSSFLLPAGHVKSDLPTALIEAQRAFNIQVEYSKPLGLHPGLLFALRDRWHAARATLPHCAPEESALLVVGRGTTDPDANAEVAKLARLMFESGECGYAQTAYIAQTQPSVQAGLDQCAALGAKQIIVLPFFLCTGVLMDRIRQQADDWAAAHPTLSVGSASHLGQHPGVVDALLDRLNELRSGEARSIWCDRCKFRTPLPGHAHHVGAVTTSDHVHGLRRARQHPAPPTVPFTPLLPPEAITARSFEIIDAEFNARNIQLPEKHAAVVRRVIHTTADFEYADLLEFSPRALEAGRVALAAQNVMVICDVRMVQTGLTSLAGRTVCYVDEDAIRAESALSGETRSALGLRKALIQYPDAIVVIGNAPTALWEALQLIDGGLAKPPLIIGVPVGFVGAEETKAALRLRTDVEWIVTRGRKGGSGVAAAIVNALFAQNA